ncbi:MAG: response regulator [Rubrivivax sp.]
MNHPEHESDVDSLQGPACDVLIADDAGGSRELLAAILRNFAGPLQIREARNGDDALALWQQLRPRITLLDIDMPGLDGLAALEQIRALDDKAFVAIVSGSSDIDKVKRALSQGAAGFVIKPYKPQRIVDLLQRYQDRSGHVLMR